MPIPSPEGQQDKNSFISNCMGDESMREEFPEQKRRAAVCYSQYKRSRKTKGSIEWLTWTVEENQDCIIY